VDLEDLCPKKDAIYAPNNNKDYYCIGREGFLICKDSDDCYLNDGHHLCRHINTAPNHSTNTVVKLCMEGTTGIRGFNDKNKKKILVESEPINAVHDAAPLQSNEDLKETSELNIEPQTDQKTGVPTFLRKNQHSIIEEHSSDLESSSLKENKSTLIRPEYGPSDERFNQGNLFDLEPKGTSMDLHKKQGDESSPHKKPQEIKQGVLDKQPAGSELQTPKFFDGGEEQENPIVSKSLTKDAGSPQQTENILKTHDYEDELFQRPNKKEEKPTKELDSPKKVLPKIPGADKYFEKNIFEETNQLDEDRPSEATNKDKQKVEEKRLHKEKEQQELPKIIIHSPRKVEEEVVEEIEEDDFMKSGFPGFFEEPIKKER